MSPSFILLLKDVLKQPGIVKPLISIAFGVLLLLLAILADCFSGERSDD